MKRLFAAALLLLLTSCTGQQTRLAALDRGFGGTGAQPCPQIQAYSPGDSGFGGTGHTDQCGFGGTGVIGTITDFGSIWVNGLEIELAPDTRITSNLGHPVELAIGQQVITHTEADALETDRVKVFYPVAGRIERIEGGMIVVAGQRIRIDEHTQGLRQPRLGEHVAINGWPRPDGSWLATRIDPNPNRIEKVDRPTLAAIRTRRALLEGTVIHRDGRILLAPYDLPLTAEEARQIKNGTLALVVAQRLRARWIIEQVRPLRQWKVEWDEIRAHSHEQAELMRHRETREILRQQPDERVLLHQQREQMEQLKETREGSESMSEHKSDTHELREALEQLREAQSQREELEEARQHQEALEELKEQ